METTRTFKHVNDLWEEKKVANIKNNELALFLYRSNILGADLRITNFGGGNTSCKTIEKDPLTLEDKEVMWIKGSGGDLGTLKRNGIAGIYVDRMRALEKVYRGIQFEDEMVDMLYHCLYDLDSRAPSIDTPLHGFLPFKHIDHLHPDALIAIAAAEDGEDIVKEIWGNNIGWVPWQRPGFDLALKLRNCLEKNPKIRGIVLGGHGLFTWGDTSYECYINSLEVIEMASEYIHTRIGSKHPVFGGAKVKSLNKEKRRKVALEIMPILRGLSSSENRMIGHYSDHETVLEFINSAECERLAAMGTSCPDHFLRTKIKPLVIHVNSKKVLNKPKEILPDLQRKFKEYREDYKTYYETHKHPDSPAMRDPNPVVILYPGIGMFTFAKNKQTARVAAEFYINAINVMRGAGAISNYTALPKQEAFNIEYWLLEEAKLKRQPPEKPLSRSIALVSGGTGGIGKAIVEKLVNEGANVVITDLDKKQLKAFDGQFSNDITRYTLCDVRKEQSIYKAFEETILAFGGIDIVIHSAGLAISKSLEETQTKDWELLQDVLVKGQYLLAQKAVEIMRKQNLGGNIINIASKNGLVSGPNNVGYGTAKASQQHMSRLLAAELGKDGIRVNTVNPDGVIIGSKIWQGKWAEERAKTYGISVEELPEFYAKRNLLNEIIRPEDIANGVFAFLAILDKCTGNTLNIDGGMPAAFVR